jgi:uncharacterized protein YutE (UPF0331/DUF86 family)
VQALVAVITNLYSGNNSFYGPDEEKKVPNQDRAHAKRAGEIEKWKQAFFTDERDRLAVYKAFQEIAEACLNITAMLLKEEKKIPEDDYANMAKLEDLGIITKAVRTVLETLTA